MDSEALLSLKEACKSKRVLYVEDDPDVRGQTAKMLRLYFHEVVEANDGVEGLHCFEQEPFDLIFTDITMPKMDGLCMIEAIRKRNPSIPIVIFSAYDTTEYFLKTIEQGISGYILKPYGFHEILATLEKVVKALPKERAHTLLMIDGYYWERATHCLCQEEKEIKLSRHERALFDLLTSSKQRIFSSEEIEIAVFDDDLSDNKRVRNLLSRLRQKLGCDLIQSIYGEGYKLRWLHL
ncbi:MAG: response regulator transcription factor [Sulfurospirillum sp.]|nr:response regulator transcription factor [Sulfurospirillum sp.]MCD8478086.1 response regulator transcription factor [Sulfurospirillum sp.]